MTSRCPKCNEVADIFHSCSSTSAFDTNVFSDESSTQPKASLLTVVVAAPLMGLILDYFLPLPSSLLNSTLISLFGSALVAFIWVSINHKRSKSIRFYASNIKNFVYTPNLLKIFSSSHSKKSTSLWASCVLAVSAFQIIFFTPGNGDYLATRVSTQIVEKSNKNLEVLCPSNTFYLYNKAITCKVRIKILGISGTVPARAKLSPFLGNSKIKVSIR